ncbi:KAP family P-loop NTPase fold protein [Stutzerimonas stutzeri]|uniref:KAP family P-loop NTPase fold protein n=1 Tax=Stutzerimonas stutzeri TaxID=316 RepID=UPI003D014573
MSIKLSEFQVNHDDIFACDKLGREAEVKNIAGLLINIPGPLTFAISSPWGTGKTSFSKLLHAHLLSQGHRAIYFNAWATDFADDPLTAFLGEMNEHLSSFLQGDQQKSEAWAKAKETGAYLARKVLPVALNIATAGILNIDERIEDKISELMGGVTEDAISEYTKDKKQIQQFRENISELASGEPKNSIYIFIDELDRCRPIYAVELLERIKHLFDVPGITFVLSMDKGQLAHSICGLYGNNFDGNGYLRRFIDVEYRLKPVKASLYAEHIFEATGLSAIFSKRQDQSRSFQYEKTEILRVLELLDKAHSLSLRDLEQYIARLRLIYYAVQDGYHVYPYITAFIVYLQMYKPAALRDRTPNEYRQSLRRELVSIAEQAGDRYDRTVAIIEAHIAMLLIDEEWEVDQSFMASHRKQEVDQTGTPEEQEYSRNVLQYIQYIHDPRSRGISFNYVLNKVSMIEQFSFPED